MSINYQHAGTTAINSDLIAKVPGDEFFESEKAKELFAKMSSAEWQDAYRDIQEHPIKNLLISDPITPKEARDFCEVSQNTYRSWNDVIPPKRVNILNLFLCYGYLDKLDTVDYIMSRICHLSEPTKKATLEDAVFCYICQKADYQKDILPIIKSRSGSPLNEYLYQAYLFLDSDLNPTDYFYGKRITKPEYLNFFIEIDRITDDTIGLMKENIKDYLNDKKKAINEKRKEQGKKPNFSNKYIIETKNVPDTFNKTISRISNRGHKYNKFPIQRDFIIKVGLHYGLTYVEINELLNTVNMDLLSYKNPVDYAIIYVVGQLEKQGILDVDMKYEDIEPIITRSNYLFTTYNKGYKEIQHEILTYFEGFKPREGG